MNTKYQTQIPKYFLLLFLIFSGHFSYSQNLYTNFFLGVANYSGDLGGSKYSLVQSHPAWGFGCLYQVNNRMAIRADVTYGKISGADKYGGPNKSRNLSFTSDIAEFSLAFEYTLFNLDDYKVSPYFFTGVSGFGFNPYTKDKNNNTVFLAELDTEGQGFYQDRKPYKTRQVAIPFGGGLMWALNDNKRLGFVVGIRKTFTDYLDDVSTTYVDENLLSAKRGSTSASIAYRGDELPHSTPYPADGTKRGNPNNKDWYYFTGVSLRMRLLPPRRQSKQYIKVKRSSVSCPRMF